MSTIDESTRTGRKKRLRSAITYFILTLLIIIAFYMTCGILVIRPVGDTENGATIVYWRLNSNMPFFCSIDSLLVEKTGDYTIYERGLLTAHLAKPLQRRCIARFGFSKYLYLLSTKGKDYQKDYF